MTKITVLTLLLATASAAAGADLFPSTMPARVGSERYVRAAYRRCGTQDERTVIRGRIAVLGVDAGGNETSGTLHVERCARIVNGVEHQLVPPGQRLLIKRPHGGGQNEFFHEDGRPLGREISRWVSLVSGLRAGADDLDFWQRGESSVDWPVDEKKLRRVIATADFDMSSIRSETRAAAGDVTARLSIPKMVGKAKQSPLVDGTFAVECRWRLGQTLQRFRRTRWVLHENRSGGDEATPALTTRIVEIVGIESDTPDPWWAKGTQDVRDEAVRFAGSDDPLLGFYCLRQAEPALKEALRSAADASLFEFQFREDDVTSLLKIEAITRSGRP